MKNNSKLKLLDRSENPVMGCGECELVRSVSERRCSNCISTDRVSSEMRDG